MSTKRPLKQTAISTSGKQVRQSSSRTKSTTSEVSSREGSAHGGFLSLAAIREIVESIAIAFMLAFLFRTFEAEAFVIPTGSMAPTLLGRHKDLTCAQCGHQFQVSASDEVDSETGRFTGRQVIGGTCPVCRYSMHVGAGNPQGREYPSYKGDRILVVKFPYQFGEPQRWDVAVFKYPGGAKTNFIKRIVGLPGETIMIRNGDLFARPAVPEDFHSTYVLNLEEFRILRKPPEKVRAMLQLVYDNDRTQRSWIEKGWPPRWVSEPTQSGRGWSVSEDYRSFSIASPESGEVAWLRYRHLVPSYDEWQRLLHGKGQGIASLQPQLISDFCSYNSEVSQGGGGWFPSSESWGPLAYSSYPGWSYDPLRPTPKQLGLHWVGDLAVEFQVEVVTPRGNLLLELVEGGRLFQCNLNLESGQAVASIDALPEFRALTSTPIKRKGKFWVMFANVDDCLYLWVNGKPMSFETTGEYSPMDNAKPTLRDREPVRIGARGTEVTVRHLRVYRDIYYIAYRANGGISSQQMIDDFVVSPYTPLTGETVTRVLSDCHSYGAARTRMVWFPLDKDQFLVLGDNSPESMDSRLWEGRNFEYYVKRELLIGRALFIYWPRSLDRIPGTNIPIRFFPNFWRMRYVR